MNFYSVSYNDYTLLQTRCASCGRYGQHSKLQTVAKNYALDKKCRSTVKRLSSEGSSTTAQTDQVSDFQARYGISVASKDTGAKLPSKTMNLVQFVPGVNGQGVAAKLQHPNGSSATIELNGAVISSWCDKKGQELMYTDPCGGLGESGEPTLSGGAIVAFPCFGPGPPNMPLNGIAANMEWSVQATGATIYPDHPDPAPTLVLSLKSTPATLAYYPHPFTLTLSVSLMNPHLTSDAQSFARKDFFSAEHSDKRVSEYWKAKAQLLQSPSEARLTQDRYSEVPLDAPFELSGKVSFGMGEETSIGRDENAEARQDVPAQLRVQVDVRNDGDDGDMQFQCGVLGHLRTRDLSVRKYQQTAALRGVYGSQMIMRDFGNTPMLRWQNEQLVHFAPHPDRLLDRLYTHIDDTRVEMCPGDRQHFSVRMMRGFRDLHVLNAGYADPQNSNHYVRIGCGKVAVPVRCPPGRTWRSDMHFQHHPYHWCQLYGDFSSETQPPLPPKTNVLLNQHFARDTQPSGEQQPEVKQHNEYRGERPESWGL